MSTWFKQNLIYGYKTSYEKFAELTENTSDEDYDNLMAENAENGWGWVVTDDYAIFGKIILRGEDYGNDDLFAAESGAVVVPFLSEEEAALARTKIYAEIPYVIMQDEIQYYVAGVYC